MDIIRDFKGFMSRQPKWLFPALIIGAIFIIPSIAVAKSLREGAKSNEKTARDVVKRYKGLIIMWCNYWGFPEPKVVAAQICEESSGNPNAINLNDPGGSRGLMQHTWATGRSNWNDLIKLGVFKGDATIYPGTPGDPDPWSTKRGTGLYDPRLSIAAGVYHLTNLYKNSGYSIENALSKYNTGGNLKTRRGATSGVGYITRIYDNFLKHVNYYW